MNRQKLLRKKFSFCEDICEKRVRVVVVYQYADMQFSNFAIERLRENE